eukprot:13636471-Alexandrium_andersonii.AAC.1
MSASLVGSEMCIRDRARTPKGQAHLEKKREAPSARPSRRGHPESAGARPCLLYTSDAADDM